MRVCVVGAGFAGLAAADALAREGADVVVLEAMERLGGRVWSERFADGVVERGGEFVTSGYDVMAELVERSGLHLDGMGITYPDRELEPDPGLDRDAVEAAAAALASAGAAAPRDPAPEVLAAAVRDPAVRELFASRVQSAVAYPFERLEGRWLTKATSLIEAGETRRVRGGNQRLAEALGAGLPRAPALGAAVRAIHADDRGVRVELDEDEVTADACIVAVPCSLVGEISFEPPLPAEIDAELRSIPMSTAAKLAVRLSGSVLARAVMSVPDRFLGVDDALRPGRRLMGRRSAGDRGPRRRGRGSGAMAVPPPRALAGARPGRRVGAADPLGRRLLEPRRLFGAPQRGRTTPGLRIVPRRLRRRAHGGRVVGNDGGCAAEWAKGGPAPAGSARERN